MSQCSNKADPSIAEKIAQFAAILHYRDQCCRFGNDSEYHFDNEHGGINTENQLQTFFCSLSSSSISQSQPIRFPSFTAVNP
jgi:hypothetical protein